MTIDFTNIVTVSRFTIYPHIFTGAFYDFDVWSSSRGSYCGRSGSLAAAVAATRPTAAGRAPFAMHILPMHKQEESPADQIDGARTPDR